MAEKADDKEKTKDQSALEIAEIMAANMAANMKDPIKFWAEKEELMQRVRTKLLKERKERKEREKTEKADHEKKAA